MWEDSIFDNVRFDVVKMGKDAVTLQANVASVVEQGLVGHFYENTGNKEPMVSGGYEWDRSSKYSLFSRMVTSALDKELKDGRYIYVTHERDFDTNGWNELPEPTIYKIDSSKRSLGTTRDRTLALSDYES